MTTDTGADVAIVPANEASWEELQTVLGVRGEASRCQCQWFQTPAARWREEHVEERAFRLRTETGCGDPAAASTSGLVAYLDGEPAGWCAVEPRRAYRRLRTSRVVWAGRDEDPDDGSVWAAVCFVTRAGFRRRGISRALAAAVPGWAEENGARAIEGYPLIPKPGQEMKWGELYVGNRSIFAAAGFREVSRPTARRAVMRIDFEE
ncbi:GNAT family N-acetyltransferase [Arthrobacter sp.]|uniref:GNAT family N-acetyltransferase n=1 Tax=Arthrobacter sp. TaxID=1667 RepID=UPI00339169C9